MKSRSFEAYSSGVGNGEKKNATSFCGVSPFCAKENGVETVVTTPFFYLFDKIWNPDLFAALSVAAHELVYATCRVHQLALACVRKG